MYSFVQQNNVQIPHGEKKELCINNSSAFFDLWNNRFLHITSSDPNFALYSKKTIVVSILNNKRIADRLEYAFPTHLLYVERQVMESPIPQMYACIFLSAMWLRILPQSQIPFILKPLHIDVWIHISYLRLGFTYINVVLMTFLVGSFLYSWR